MIGDLSPNTKAILLLTAPLISGKSSAPADLLKPAEYKRLARHLREIQREPADLVSPDGAALFDACQQVVDAERLRRLVARGFLLSQVVERWRARAIWVVSRADNDYPRRLKSKLREDAPAVLYGCGDIGLLDRGGLAVVGSRHVDEVLVEYTRAVGELAARAERTIVSGGAKGIDQAGMRGALDAGGKAIGVLADSLERSSMQRDHRNLLLDGQLVLVSPYDPGAGFNVGNAMQRNKLIYAFADAALVVSSDLNKGGTWSGAVEQLDKLRFVPVYVRSNQPQSEGLDALRQRGAIAWPDPQDVDSFGEVFSALAPATPQAGLSFAPSEESANVDHVGEESAVWSAAPGHADVACEEALEDETPATPEAILLSAVRESIQRVLASGPLADAEVARALGLTNAQAKAWLKLLVEEGLLEKKAKPVRYVVRQQSLF